METYTVFLDTAYDHWYCSVHAISSYSKKAHGRTVSVYTLPLCPLLWTCSPDAAHDAAQKTNMSLFTLHLSSAYITR